MRRAAGILGQRSRRWAWVAFLAMAVYAPFVAYQMSDDSWMFSIAVAGLVATVIIADDLQRVRPAGRSPADG